MYQHQTIELIFGAFYTPFWGKLDPLCSVVFMYESPTQLIAETITPIPAKACQLALNDYELSR